ncbi:MAG TPA: flagellar hook-associated protein FlgL [Fimbriimonadaceae bacterium]|nr:flagellar hook-associated protein FlgL [Fimbriimonadaceae bacterium]
MRVSTSYQYDSFSRQIRDAQSRYVAAQRVATSGKRLEHPSDDPFGTSVSLSARAVRSAIEQYDKNLVNARGVLGLSENAVSGLNDLLREGYTMAVRAAQTTVDQEGRNGMAAQVAELQRRLVALGNSRGPAGEYLFGGQKNDVAPFAAANGALTFSGDNNSVIVETGPGVTMSISTPGEQLFKAAYDKLESLRQNLLGGTTSSTEGDIQPLQDQMAVTRAQLAEIGSRMRSVTTLKTDNARRLDGLAVQISDVEDVDMAEAIVALKQAENAYTAALQVGSQGFNLSLMDFIR